MALALARFSREKLREMPEATGDIREIVGQVCGALAPRRSTRQPPQQPRNPRATRAPRLRLAGAAAAHRSPRVARRCGSHVGRSAHEAAALRTRQTVDAWSLTRGRCCVCVRSPQRAATQPVFLPLYNLFLIYGKARGWRTQAARPRSAAQSASTSRLI